MIGLDTRLQCVAGADAPAFVERDAIIARRVSPGLTLRPSLSAAIGREHRPRVDGVAGADAPAFVERLDLISQAVAAADVGARPGGTGIGRVAGADAPAFVERQMDGMAVAGQVSPGLTLRPSLSGTWRIG